MVSGRYLALHPAEFEGRCPLPGKSAWMVCPFSPEWRMPPVLPRDSLLILTDEILPDKTFSAGRLLPAVAAMDCAGVILDFQRPSSDSLQQLAGALLSALPCPVALPEPYAASRACPVFLSPCPHHVPLPEHLAPWQGREIWLDLAADAEVITLTGAGAVITPLVLGEHPHPRHKDDTLHCHYTIETGIDFARFTLWRTREDLEGLSKEAERLGIQTLIGLWSEWQTGE